MAKKNKIYMPKDYQSKMNQWIQMSQSVPTVSASIDLNRRFNYIDPSSISMEDAMVEEALPDIEFEKIKVESRVQVKFALD